MLIQVAGRLQFGPQIPLETTAKTRKLRTAATELAEKVPKLA